MSIEVSRIEDMSIRGCLRVIKQDDGDIIVAVHGADGEEITDAASVEFCEIGMGGGRSPHTLRALDALMKAIEIDNKERPIGT